MTNEEKLKALLIEMELLDEEKMKSRNDLYVLAYQMDNDLYKICTEGLPRQLYDKVDLFDLDFAEEIIRAISDVRERIRLADITL